jgi:threonine/homoserine/homoserine lactone efflux protein
MVYNRCQFSVFSAPCLPSVTSLSDAYKYPPVFSTFMLELLAAGFLIGLTHAMPPGPVTIEVLRRGAVDGLVSALKVDAGSVVADAVFFMLIMIGLMQLINGNEGRLIIWAFGCIMLLALGVRGLYKALRKKKAAIADNNADGNVKKELSPFLTGFMICITSPFAIMWWAGIFAGSTALIQPGYDTMSVVFAGIAFAVLAWYALVGISGAIGRKLVSGRSVDALSVLCSAMMVVFSVILFYRGYTTLL